MKPVLSEINPDDYNLVVHDSSLQLGGAAILDEVGADHPIKPRPGLRTRARDTEAIFGFVKGEPGPLPSTDYVPIA